MCADYPCISSNIKHQTLGRHSALLSNLDRQHCSPTYQRPLRPALLFLAAPAISLSGLQSGQISGLLQLTGSSACLFTSTSGTAPTSVWGGTVDNGNFACDNTDAPLGDTTNTFTTYFAGELHLAG